VRLVMTKIVFFDVDEKEQAILSKEFEGEKPLN
jgi:hypothetical protein